MVVRVNTDLTGLLQQQQANAAGAARTAKPEGKPAGAGREVDTAEIRKVVASENRAAGRTEPLDADQAAATALALRTQIQANPDAAFGAHDISADRARDLLS